jgi:hypothetical protein
VYATSSSIRPILLLTLLAPLSGCGDSKEASARDGQSSGGEQALPPLPSEPVALVPAGASMVVSVEVASLRGTPLFDVLTRYAAQQSCGGAAPAGWLIDRAERMVVAGFERAPEDTVGPEMRSLLIVRAPAAAGDAARLIVERAKVQGQPEPAVQETPRGRFFYAEHDGIAAARLGDHLLAIGDAPALAAALDVADGKQRAWPNGDAAAQDLLQKGWLSGHSAGLIGRISERGAKRMKRALSRVGAGSAPLDQGALTLSLDVTDGLRANAQIGLPDAASAERATGELTNSFGQLDLILRLTGLPTALAHPEISTEGKNLKLSLTLSAGDVRILLDRMDSFAPPGQPRCT